MVMNWQASNSLSNRSGPLLDKDPSYSSVGPGSYNPNKFPDKKPQSMFLPRDGLRNQPSFFNNGSIKDNFEPNEIDNENIVPGPGHYATDTSSFKSRTRPKSLQFFGSSVHRFKDNLTDNELGPGQYKISRRIGSNSLFGVAGTSTFKSPPRKDLFSSA